MSEQRKANAVNVKHLVFGAGLLVVTFGLIYAPTSWHFTPKVGEWAMGIAGGSMFLDGLFGGK